MSEELKEVAPRNIDAWNPLSLDEAKRLRVCRICRVDDLPRPGNPFKLGFGTEYAHEKCIAMMDVVPTPLCNVAGCKACSTWAANQNESGV